MQPVPAKVPTLEELATAAQQELQQLQQRERPQQQLQPQQAQQQQGLLPQQQAQQAQPQQPQQQQQQQATRFVSRRQPPAGPRCVREWLTDLDSWYSHIPRRANETDCEFLCTHDKASWCVWHEFKQDESSSCKLFDGCDTDTDKGGGVGADTGAAAQGSEAAAQGDEAEEEAERQLKAGCDCKWAGANSCAPHSNDDSRCWGVCCSGYSSDPPGV